MAPFSTRQTVGSPSQSARLLPSKIWVNPVRSLKSIAAGSWNCERMGGAPGWGAAAAWARAIAAEPMHRNEQVQRRQRRLGLLECLADWIIFGTSKRQ